MYKRQGYDEYRYDLGMIGHDPHELAAFLSAVLQGYTQQSAQAELARVFAAQYQLTLSLIHISHCHKHMEYRDGRL